MDSQESTPAASVIGDLYLQIVRLIDDLSTTESKDEIKVQIKTLFNDSESSMLLSVDIYLRWLHFSCGEFGSKDEFLAAFQSIVSNCPDFALITLSMDKIIQFNEQDEISSEEVRKCFEQCITACGGDIFVGCEVWKRYTDFEVDEFEDTLDVDTSDEEAIKVAKERFIKLFHRQLSLPLVGNETTLQQFEILLSEHCTEADLSIIKPDQLTSKYQRGMKLREERLPYEIPFYDKKYPTLDITSRMLIWKNYFDYEIKSKELSRVQRLYERWLLAFSHDNTQKLSIYIEYVSFLLHTVKNYTFAYIIIQRAMKDEFCHKHCILLYKWKLLLIELTNTSNITTFNIDSFTNIQTEVRNTVINIVFTYYPFQQAQDYLDILFASCNLTRRIAGKVSEHAKKQLNHCTDVLLLQFCINELQNQCTMIESTLQSYYNTWYEGWLQYAHYAADLNLLSIQPIQQLIASVENATKDSIEFNSLTTVNTTKTMKKAPLLQFPMWNDLVSKFPNNYHIYAQQYFPWLISHQYYDQTRAMYRKIQHYSFDDTTAVKVSNDWLFFEDSYSDDIQTLLHAYKATHPVLLPTYLSMTTPQSIATVTPSSKENAANKSKETTRGKKRAADNDDNHHGNQINQSTSSNKKQRVVSFHDNTHSTNQEAITSMDVDITPQQLMPPPASTVKTKVSISNFPFTATIDEIKSFLAPYIDEKAVVVELILSKAGKSRGMVSITPAHEVLSKLATEPSLEYHGRKLTVVEEPIVETPSTSSSTTTTHTDNNTSTATEMTKKNPYHTCIFVSNIDETISDTDLKQFFQGCGEILAARVALDKKTGKSKCNAIVQFLLPSSLKVALQLDKTDFHGKEIVIRPSRFGLVPIIHNDPPVEESKDERRNNFHQYKERSRPVHEESNKSADIEAIEHPPVVAISAPENKKKVVEKTTMFKPRAVSSSSSAVPTKKSRINLN